MKSYTTLIPDVLILAPSIFRDDRGVFFESFNAKVFYNILTMHGIYHKPVFVQDNHSMSNCGVLRGLHYQIRHPQGKLVRVVKGSAFDVVVDLRRPSKTFGMSFGVELNQDNCYQLWIPPGFAHGFLALSDNVEFLYKATDYRYSEYERSIIWNDKDLNINWPIHLLPNNLQPILSEKDNLGSSFIDAEIYERLCV